jgi:riboflavin kinase/FMN adenylyltransferase
MATQVYRTLKDVVRRTSSINTVGTFDGLHLGHQTILHELRREATERGATATVVTFSPHPQLVLRHPTRPAVKMLTTDDEKIALLEAAQIDRIVVIPFTLEFSKTSSDAFVREILFQRIGMSGVVLGHDHGFGKNREGDFALMARLGAELDFSVRELPPFEMDGVVLSSTRIRELLLNGEVSKAARFLDRPYRFTAAVGRGDGRGRELGFPTANLHVDDPDKLIPAHGVYAVRVDLGQKKFGGMLNLGTRPTFQKNTETIEVNIFDVDEDLYGKKLAVEFVQRLRSEKAFASVAELIEQLEQDRSAAQRVFAADANFIK